MPQFIVDCRLAGSHYIFATVRVQTAYPDGSSGSGTAFFFRTGAGASPQAHFLVTNKHVLEGASSAHLRFHYGGSNEPWQFTVAETRSVTVSAGQPLWFPHPDPDVDLCALRVSDLRAQFPQLQDIYFTSISESEILDDESERRLPSMMTIAMVGYPQGIWDEQNNLNSAARKYRVASRCSVRWQTRSHD